MTSPRLSAYRLAVDVIQASDALRVMKRQKALQDTIADFGADRRAADRYMELVDQWGGWSSP